MGGPERLSRVDIGVLVCEAFGFRKEAIKEVPRYVEGKMQGAGPKNPQDLAMDSTRLAAAYGLPPPTTVAQGLAQMSRGNDTVV